MLARHTPHTRHTYFFALMPLVFCHSVTLIISLSLSHTHTYNQQAVSILSAGEVVRLSESVCEAEG